MAIRKLYEPSKPQFEAQTWKIQGNLGGELSSEEELLLLGVDEQKLAGKSDVMKYIEIYGVWSGLVTISSV